MLGVHAKTLHYSTSPPGVDLSKVVTNSELLLAQGRTTSGQMNKCARCHTLARDLAKGQKLRQCAGCQQRWYCGEACQREAWEAGHKKECKQLKMKKEKNNTPTNAPPHQSRGG